MTTAVHRTKWFLPLFSAALGVACLVALWIGDEPGLGLASLGIMCAFGLVFLLGGRSETIRGLRGNGRDERFAAIDRDATLVAGNILIGLVIALCLWEWAQGRDGSPYTALGALTGLSYLAAVVWFRVRS
jgi:hypothetical protein